MAIGENLKLASTWVFQFRSKWEGQHREAPELSAPLLVPLANSTAVFPWVGVCGVLLPGDGVAQFGGGEVDV